MFKALFQSSEGKTAWEKAWGEGSTSPLPKGVGKEEGLARAMCPTGMSSGQAVSMGPRRAVGAWAWQWGDKWGK